jgi:anti-anti-sigma factor
MIGATGAFRVTRSQKARVVVFDGAVNADAVASARRALERALLDVSWLVFDWKALGYVGSTGLAASVKLAETLEARRGGLVVFSVTRNLASVIETLGLRRYLKLAPDLGAAFAGIRG